MKIISDDNHHHNRVNHGVISEDKGSDGVSGVCKKVRAEVSANDREQQLHPECFPLFDDETHEVEWNEWAYVTWLDVGRTIDNLLFWGFFFITISATATVLILFLY